MPLNIPYKLVASIAGLAIGAAALVTLFFSWSARGQEIARLTSWQTTVVQVVTDATVEPDAKGFRKTLDPVSVPRAVVSLARSLDSCHAARVEADRVVADARARSDRADAALANANVLMSNQYESAAKRIKALAETKAAKTPDLQCQAIGQDSKAAWEGWK